MPETTFKPDTALLFPGQGSQTAGMRELVERFEPELLELALDAVGVDPFELVDVSTRFTQPAIFCASVAGWSRAGRPRASLSAGHSLGELSALTAAGSILPADGLILAVTRGRLMQEAAELAPGGMMALLGDGGEARAVASSAGLVVANDNGPTQIVVAGPADALETATAEAKARGLRSIRLAVRGAFHTPAMDAVVEPFRAALAQIAVEPPRSRVFSSTTARPFEGDADAIRDQLASAMARPVRWRETLLELHRLGVRRFVEAGPGRALTGMVRRAFDGVEAAPLAEAEPAHA
jgi:acyl transferase domain-containing protein